MIQIRVLSQIITMNLNPLLLDLNHLEIQIKILIIIVIPVTKIIQLNQIIALIKTKIAVTVLFETQIKNPTIMSFPMKELLCLISIMKKKKTNADQNNSNNQSKKEENECKEGSKCGPVKNKDRPSIEIYNPAARRQQKQQLPAK